LNSAKEWLSYDIVSFKIELEVEEKFKCKNVTKQTQHVDWAVAAGLWPAVIFAVAQHTTHAYDAYGEPSQTESFDSARLVLNGDNMLGLCYPSNLLFEYSFYPPRSDTLFSSYFEDLLLLCSCRTGFSGSRCEHRDSDGMSHKYACTEAEAQSTACLHNGTCFATYIIDWTVSCEYAPLHTCNTVINKYKERRKW